MSQDDDTLNKKETVLVMGFLFAAAAVLGVIKDGAGHYQRPSNHKEFDARPISARINSFEVGLATLRCHDTAIGRDYVYDRLTLRPETLRQKLAKGCVLEPLTPQG